MHSSTALMVSGQCSVVLMAIMSEMTHKMKTAIMSKLQ